MKANNLFFCVILSEAKNLARLVARPFASLRVTAYVMVLASFVLGNVSGQSDPSRDWEWIIIHHSATRMGSAEVFDAAHRSRGMINGLAYHFVIDNGTEGKADGFIETGPRWIKQMQGGHCRQAYINEQGIGICLVGNFSVDQPTSKQLDSLVLLIHGLQEQFHIPNDHILGHGEVIGEFSECPGSQFPWDEFHKRLREAGGTVSSVVTTVPARNPQVQAHR
jgi:N-acetyl-anhydromuramyl-L-alanine amidase AmpD